MNVSELREEIKFGLENLERVYLRIEKFVSQEIDIHFKTSALAYECLGYYNALEHLILRIFKYLGVAKPSGPFFHRDILKIFEKLVRESGIECEESLFNAIEDLMAFRHVATKIYGFLLDWDKLKFVISEIETYHGKIRQFFLAILETLEAGELQKSR